jgi:hypothetical protein
MVNKNYNVDMWRYGAHNYEYYIRLTMRIFDKSETTYVSARNINVIKDISGNSIEELLSSELHEMMKEINNSYKMDVRLPELLEHVKKQMERFIPEFDE